MIKTAQDAYLAGRQAAMEKLANRMLAQVGKTLLRGGRGAAARGAVARAAAPATRTLARSSGRNGNLLGRVAGGLGVAGLGYGVYRGIKDGYIDFTDPRMFAGVAGSGVIADEKRRSAAQAAAQAAAPQLTELK